MNITKQQFVSNYNALQEEEQVMVSELIENNPVDSLKAFASTFGVTLSMGTEEPQEPMQEPSEEVSESEQAINSPPEGRDTAVQDQQMQPINSPPEGRDTAVQDQEAQPMNSPPEGRQTPLQEMQQQLQEGGVAGQIQQEGADESGVADDVPVEAEDGAFIINAAAVDEVGELDLEQRIIQPAVAALQKEGIKITIADLKKPQQQVNGDVPIAASNGEYYIPRALARKIGYGLLKKINARGEKETKEKISEQEQKEQQPQEQQAEMQAALGKRIEMKEGGEVDILARILFAEAGGEGEEGMSAVASSIGNRVRSSEFPNKYSSVIKQKDQYTGITSKKYKNPEEAYKNNSREKAAWELAKSIARKEISGKLEDITDGAMWYRVPEEKNPSGAGSTKKGMDWFDKNLKDGSLIVLKTIGKHNFIGRPINSPPEGRELLEEERLINSSEEGRELAEDTSFMADTNSPEEGRELLPQPSSRGSMRPGLDRVQPVMDEREITQFPERVLQ